MAEPSNPKRSSSTSGKTSSGKAKPAPSKARKAKPAPVDEAAASETLVSAAELAEQLEEVVETKQAVDEDPENAPVEPVAEAGPDVETDVKAVEAAKVAASGTNEVTLPPAQRAPWGVVVPAVLGGVVALALGAAGLFLAQDRGWITLGGDTAELQATLIAQSDAIAGVQKALEQAQGEIAGLHKAMPDGAALIAADATAGSARAGLAETVAALQARIESVEMQPIPMAELPEEVAAAYEARLAKMQAALDAKLAEIAAAQIAASATEDEALRAAAAAAAEAALSRIGLALDNGTGFADDLQIVTEKSGHAAPQVLAELATEGAPTLLALKASFPEAARAALIAATQQAVADGEVSGLTGFFRTQLGARSLAPRDGEDPDAVLSRAEAAVAGGELDTALGEIAALPQVAQDALADWVAQTEIRRAALAAAAVLAADLNK